MKDFDSKNIIHNSFSDYSNGYFNIEKLVVQTNKEERKALLDLIDKLKQEIVRLNLLLEKDGN